MYSRLVAPSTQWIGIGRVGLALLVTAAMACSENSPGDTSVGPTSTPEASPSSPVSAESPTAPGTPRTSAPLAIRITDSPFSDASAVLITFSEVSVHNADTGEWLVVPFAGATSRTCDLKQLEGPTDLLGVGSLPAAKYTQIRLHVSDATIYFDAPSVGPTCAPAIAAPAGESAPVKIPSGEVKLNHPFTLAAAGTTITLDFDGDRSIRETGNGGGNGNDKGNGKGNGGTDKDKDNSKYMMSPVIRVVSVQ